jgi:CheY-like chemotaxis protein
MPHKLLLADDSITIQRVIELTFADEDVQVIAVGDGRQAIDRLRSERPDIVLADIGMPERDGYEVAAFVKGDPQLAHIPVLLLTGAFEPIDETRARAVGSDGVLVKPFEPQVVITRVKDLLSRPRAPEGQAAAPPPAARTPLPVVGAAPAPPPAASEPQAAPDSLESYFDRLDAAFASVGAPAAQPEPPDAIEEVSAAPVPFRRPGEPAAAPEAAARTGTAADHLEGWDPDLSGDPARSPARGAPAPAPPPVGVAPAASPAGAAPGDAPPAAAPVPTAPPVAPAIPVRSLAEAFAALLAAEQDRPVAPPQAPAASEEAVEEIVRRVLDRMAGDTVRQTVVHVAERLVREEIERIKGS